MPIAGNTTQHNEKTITLTISEAMTILEAFVAADDKITYSSTLTVSKKIKEAFGL